MTASATTIPDDSYTLDASSQQLTRLFAIVGGAALAVAFVLGAMNGDEGAYFLHSYLLNYVYYLSIALGGLFFVILQHLSRAGWSVALRRLAEVLAMVLPFWSVVFLPVLAVVILGGGSLYRWNDSAVVEASSLLQGKAAYLNSTFFTIRTLIYFIVWTLLARWYWRHSLAQDESGDPAVSLKLQRWSGPAMILLAFTFNFCAFDWLMSLTPEWFSTIFGVYFFAGCALACLCAVILMAFWVQNRGLLLQSIKVDHYHDLGKLLFGFVVFWGYIAFSQYMLIWYGNMPEETDWFMTRQTNGWALISLFLLFGHLLLPLCGLLSRHVRRHRLVLTGWAVWLLAMHWFDLYWLVMPGFQERPSIGLVDVLCFVGLGGIFVAVVLRNAGKCSLLPLKDPRLHEALAFKNV